MDIISTPSPNFGARAEGVSPSMIVLHYTGMESGAAALERMCEPASEVSAHYMIEGDGRIFQLVAEDKRAWHAGRSYWAGERDINAHSIGIEIVNAGHEFGYHDFPEAQIVSVQALCADVIARHDISAARILAHSDIAPERKSDPGELFPWAALAAQTVGLWPEVSALDREAGADLLVGSSDGFHGLLCGFGYDPMADFSDVVRAFHRHFYPETFGQGEDTDVPDCESAARILALIRAANALEA